MASVRREDGPRGPRWRVRYRRPDGRETSQRFDRAGTAHAFAATVETSKLTGSYVDPVGPRTPFRVMAERWAAVADHVDSTIEVRDRDLRLHVLPVIGHLRLGQLSALELAGLQRQLERDLAPATVQRVWSWVSAICTAAVTAKLIPISPAAGMMPRRPPRSELVPLEGDMVEAVIAELPEHYQAAAILAADAGLRQGEVFGLVADRVGFLSRQRDIRVQRQLVIATGGQPYLRFPKGAKTRLVPVGPAVMDPLAAHLAAFGRAEAVDAVETRSVELIFATRTGAPVGRNAMEAVWRRAVRRAGLPQGARFHDLRHYYASVLIDAGLPEREIGARLGHSSAEVTARYGHLFRRADDRTRDAVEAAATARRAAR